VERYELLIGTHTDGDTNHLMVCGVDIPNLDTDELNEFAGVSCLLRCYGSLYVKKRIVHEGHLELLIYHL